MLTVETMKIDGGTQGVKVSVKKSEVLDRVDPPIMSKIVIRKRVDVYPADA